MRQGYTPVGRMDDSDRRGASALKTSTGRGRGAPVSTAVVEDDNGEWAMAYIEKLDTWDPYDKRSALTNLAAEGRRAAPHAATIAKCLFDEEDEDASHEVRKAAAYCLGKVGPACGKGIAKDIGTSLDKEKDAGARAEKARALGLLGREVAGAFSSKIAALAADPDEAVGLASVEALTSLGEVDMIGAFIDNPCGQVRRTAINEVARSAAARLKHKDRIAGRISDKEHTVRLAAVQAIGDIGDAAGEKHLALLGALHSKEKQVRVRKMAVQSLGKVGQAGIPSLLELFKDPDEGVRHAAGETLGGVIGGPEAASGAASMLSDKSPTVRHSALLAIGRCEKAGLRYARKVSEHLHDPDFEARLAAIQAISDMRAGSQAEELSALASDPSKGVRQASVHALAKLGEDGAAEAWKFIEDVDQAVRCCAIRVYSPLHSKVPGEIAKPFAGVVATRLDDEDWRVRFEAAKALGDLHASEFAEQVGALCKDPDGQTRRTAVSALAKMNERAWPLLMNFLEDEDPKVAKEARLEVAEKGGVDALKALEIANAANPGTQAAQPPAPVQDDGLNDADREFLASLGLGPEPARDLTAVDDDDEVIDAESSPAVAAVAAAPSGAAPPAATGASGAVDDDDEVIDAEEEVLSEPD